MFITISISQSDAYSVCPSVNCCLSFRYSISHIVTLSAFFEPKIIESSMKEVIEDELGSAWAFGFDVFQFLIFLLLLRLLFCHLLLLLLNILLLYLIHLLYRVLKK